MFNVEVVPLLLSSMEHQVDLLVDPQVDLGHGEEILEETVVAHGVMVEPLAQVEIHGEIMEDLVVVVEAAPGQVVQMDQGDLQELVEIHGQEVLAVVVEQVGVVPGQAVPVDQVETQELVVVPGQEAQLVVEILVDQLGQVAQQALVVLQAAVEELQQDQAAQEDLVQ